jgi:WD40 repeat protein
MIQLTDGRIVSGSEDETVKIWDTISGNCLITLRGHTSYVWRVTQLTDGRLVSASADDTLRIWNIMSLSQQKWIRRRLLVLLFGASKILSEPSEFDVIHPEKYRGRRRQDLQLLLRHSLDLNRINTSNDNKVNKLFLTVLSMTEIAILIAEYL